MMRQLTTRTFGILVTVMAVLLSTAAFAAIGPLTGNIKISNDRDRAVSILVDGAAWGKVAPRSARVLRNIPNGIRLVTITSRRGHETTERVSVAIDRTARMRLAPLLGAAIIRNNSGVKMRLAIDGRRVGKLRPGQRLETEPMRPGTYTLTATPRGHRDSAQRPLTVQFTIRAGESSRVKIGRYLANISITNPFPFPVRAIVGDSSVIIPSRGVASQEVAPGVIRVSLKRGAEVVAGTRLNVAPGQRRSWAPQVATTGELRIHNGTGTTLRVKVNGQRIGRFAPGESRTVRGLQTGAVSIIARTSNGRTIREHATIMPYRDARISLRSPAPVAATPASYNYGYADYAHNF